MDGLQPGDPGSVGGYRLLGRLGAGGMGQVFLGESPSGRKVAVKLVHPVLANAPQFRERFAREIAVARRVGGFHTAQVVDADPLADPPWMVTAYIDGPSLDQAVEQGGPLPPDQVRVLCAGLAEGLAAIHSHGLVHRDLKPGNVILAGDGPRIIDFGIARAVGAKGLTSAGVVIGTFGYMSPEQVRGQTAVPASDVFSLGCVLAFAASGNSPFGSDSAAAVLHRIVSQPPDLADLPDAELGGLIRACLAKEPGDRPSAHELLAMVTGAAPAAAAGFAAPTVLDTAPAGTTEPARASGIRTRTHAGAVPPAGPSSLPVKAPPGHRPRPSRSRRRLAAGAALVACALAFVLPHALASPGIRVTGGSHATETTVTTPHGPGPGISAHGTGSSSTSPHGASAGAPASPPLPGAGAAGAATIAAAPVIVPGKTYSVNLLTAAAAQLVPAGDGPQDGSVCPIWAGRWWKLDLRAGDTVSVNWSYSSPASGFYQFLVFSPSTTDASVLGQASQGSQLQFANSDSSPANGSFTVSSTGTYPFIIGDGCPSTSGPFQFTITIQH